MDVPSSRTLELPRESSRWTSMLDKLESTSPSLCPFHSSPSLDLEALSEDPRIFTERWESTSIRTRKRSHRIGDFSRLAFRPLCPEPRKESVLWQGTFAGKTHPLELFS